MSTWSMDAGAIARSVRGREVSCVEAIRDSLARIDALNASVVALAEVCAEEAPHAAQRADRVLAAAEATGPLHGVPVTLKVNVDQAGWATTNGVVA